MTSANTQVKGGLKPMSEVRVVDLAEIAELLQVAKTTPQQWRQRGQLPEPDPEMSKADKPLWRTDVIVSWAQATNRWPPGTASRPRKDP